MGGRNIPSPLGLAALDCESSQALPIVTIVATAQSFRIVAIAPTLPAPLSGPLGDSAARRNPKPGHGRYPDTIADFGLAIADVWGLTTAAIRNRKSAIRN
jgi:hypothetical protein